MYCFGPHVIFVALACNRRLNRALTDAQPECLDRPGKEAIVAVEKCAISMSEEKLAFPLPKEVSERTYLESTEECRRIYRESIESPGKFWGQLAEQFHWCKQWDKVLLEAFANGEHRWLVGAEMSVCQGPAACRLKAWRKNEAASTSARFWLRIFVFVSLTMLFWLLAAVFSSALASKGAGVRGTICGAAVCGSAAVILNAVYVTEVLPIGPGCDLQ